MQIAITGAGGQLAYDLRNAFADHQLLLWDRQALDLADRAAIQQMLATHRPDWVINTAAYNLVDAAESEPQAAYATNAVAIGHLAMECGRADIPLLHFSTDYVFGADRDRRRPYAETDLPGPTGVYGVSKLAGEQVVQAYCPQHLIVRVCGLFGVRGSRGKGGNFVEAMLRYAADPSRHPLRVVNDQTCTPTATAEVARGTLQLIESKPPWGVYHLTAAGECTWYEFAQEIFRQSGIQPPCVPVTAAEFGAAARRPRYSVLANQKIQAVGVAPLKHWQEGLADYLQVRKAYRA